MKLNNNLVFFTGGGTGGHIYPGLAVVEEFKNLCKKYDREVQVYWLGCSKGMDRKIVESSLNAQGQATVEKFFGIPSGKLRRYFSLKNFSDLFRIIGGFFSAFHILKKYKPSLLFSKGGFVSVPPCFAAKMLGIPVFTHECDFTMGLANRINYKSAKKTFVSYEETKARLGNPSKILVSGNPVRPVFYNADGEAGRGFLGLTGHEAVVAGATETAETSGASAVDESSAGGLDKFSKPILLVLGGSSGARQINNLVFDNIEWLCSHFIVVHQTGLLNADDNRATQLKEKYKGSYLPYNFIYKEMPDVLAAADLVLSRAGANSIWECACMKKPMVLVPLCGNGTRGDQVDNAKFFEEKGAAKVLLGQDADSEHLIQVLLELEKAESRAQLSQAVEKLLPAKLPAIIIAENLFAELCGEN